MTHPFPPGQPGFVSNPIDRAAHLRSDSDKLLALEGHRDSRAYVVHRGVVRAELHGEALTEKAVLANFFDQ